MQARGKLRSLRDARLGELRKVFEVEDATVAKAEKVVDQVLERYLHSIPAALEKVRTTKLKIAAKPTPQVKPSCLAPSLATPQDSEVVSPPAKVARKMVEADKAEDSDEEEETPALATIGANATVGQRLSTPSGEVELVPSIRPSGSVKPACALDEQLQNVAKDMVPAVRQKRPVSLECDQMLADTAMDVVVAAKAADTSRKNTQWQLRKDAEVLRGRTTVSRQDKSGHCRANSDTRARSRSAERFETRRLSQEV